MVIYSSSFYYCFFGFDFDFMLVLDIMLGFRFDLDEDFCGRVFYYLTFMVIVLAKSSFSA